MSDNNKRLNNMQIMSKLNSMRQKSALAKTNMCRTKTTGGQLAFDIDVSGEPIDHVLIKDYIKDKQAGQDQQDTINRCRNITSKLFYREGKPKPSITSCSDGTGSGKSFGQLKAYIRETNVDETAQGHRCLFFITPLKNQIDFSESLVKEALNKGIYFVPFLSRQDLYTMSFSNWLPDIDNRIETNEARYLRWIKARHPLRSKYEKVSKCLISLDSAIRALEAAEFKLKDTNLTEGMRASLEDSLMYERNGIVSTLSQLAIACIDTSKKTLKSLLDSHNWIERLLAEMIVHSFPLEMAKVRPCIFMSTTRKFDFNASILRRKEDGTHYRVSMPFARLLGGKKRVGITEFGKYVSQSHEKQMEYLTTNYLLPDEKNIFREQDISFDLVIDEEHESYGILSKSCTTNLLDNKATQMPDVLAGIHRIIRQVEGYELNPTVPVACFDEKKELIDIIKGAIKDHCSLSNDYSLKRITGLFSNKVDHFLIRSTNVEQIVNLTKNVFSFRPKRFFNENGLRNIRIHPTYFDSTYEIYFTEDKEDESASLFDIYQVLLASLYGAAFVKNNSKMQKQLRERSAHNETLARFIAKARNVRGEVAQMFDKTTDSDIEITPFFTFFLPKAVFSIEKCNDLDYFDKGDGTEGVTYVDFRLDIITELPEAGLAQFLYNTDNTILTLSATSGINGVCNGQYDRGFLDKYSISGLRKPDLGYTLINRNNGDIQPLANLRSARDSLRDVSFKIIPESATNLSPEDHSEEFKQVYRRWYGRLSNKLTTFPGNPSKFQKTKRGKYKEREFGRILGAVLMAAFDKKNSLILSLSGDFFKEIRTYLKSQNTYPDNLEIIQLEGVKQPSIIELRPFDNEIKLRIILFESSLGQAIDVREFMQLSDQNTKIAFVSHYRGAGTGLNYFVNYNGLHEEDFERLVLVNSPYWSQVSTNEGWNTLENYVTLMKYYANSSGTKRLSDFSTSLITGDNYKILQVEHLLELVKVVMQALGRVERRDTKISTEIFMPEDVHRNAILQFQRLKRNPRNEIFCESMSLLNYKWMENCDHAASAASFTDIREREKFEKDSKKQAKLLDTFFNVTVRQILEKARSGDMSAIEFNEALRHIDCVVNPTRYIKRLKATKMVKADPYISKVLDAFYINIGNKNQNVKVCRKDSDPKILTDMLHGDSEYDPVTQLLGFTRKTNDNINQLAATILKAGQSLEENAFNGQIPHPATLSLLKGNVGEYLVLMLLKELEITPFTTVQIIEQIGARAYELFDVYVVIKNVLTCIDAKNWTTASDKEEMSLNTHGKAVSKLSTIKEYVGENYNSIKCIYVNTRKEQNDANYVFAEVAPGEEMYYLNMFKEITGYGPATKYRQRPDGTKVTEEIGRLANTICINEKLMQLLNNEEV